MRQGVIHQILVHVTTDRLLKFVTLLGSLYIIILIYVGIRHRYAESWNRTYTKNEGDNSSRPILVKKEDMISNSLPNDITVVTAYFNLGTFEKGYLQTFTTNTYKSWMKSYGMLNNTVIAYTDSEDIAIQIKMSRVNFPSQMTKVIKVERDSLWAFKLAPQIKKIYSTPGYPQFKPNTVNEYYSCAMHVKYELIEKVILEKLYNTKYVAWVDIGYFRDKEDRPFKLLPPTDIKDDHIAFVQIHPFYSTLSPGQIIYTNSVWVAGGFVLGRPEYLLIFIADYKEAVSFLINKELMSTDQQVLYTMFSKATDFKPRVPLQTYSHPCKCDWFYLGEICRERWERNYRKLYVKLMTFFLWLI